MTADELRSAMLHESFRGFDPRQVEVAIERWTAAVARGDKLSIAELSGQRFKRAFRGYDPPTYRRCSTGFS